MLSPASSFLLKTPPSSSCGTGGEEVWGGPMLSPTTSRQKTLLTSASSCGTGGEEVWEVPGPNAEPDYFTPEDISNYFFFFLRLRWGRSPGGASAARSQRRA